MSIIDQAHMEFNGKASKLFLSLFTMFDQASSHLDRREDNNVFYQLQGKYIYTLKMQLEEVAVQVLNKYRHAENTSHLEKVLTEDVSVFINEFKRKSGTM